MPDLNWWTTPLIGKSLVPKEPEGALRTFRIARFRDWSKRILTATKLSVFPDRLMWQTGRFRPQFRQIPIRQVTDAWVSQGYLERSFVGSGNLTINTAGGTIEFEGVEDVHEAVELIMEQIQ